MEWYWVLAGVIIFIFFVIVNLTGCAVVKTDISSNSRKEATVYYYLPESVLKIRVTTKVAVVYDQNKKLTGSSRVVQQSFSVTSEMIADTKDLLSLNYKPNVMMADEIKYGVNAKGLLETVNVITDDRTAEIIAKLTEAPNIILGISAGGARGANEIVKMKEYTSEFMIKAVDLASTGNPPKPGSKQIGWNIVIENELGVDELPQVLPADFNVSSTGVVTTGTALSSLVNSSNSGDKKEIEGILTRPLKNISISISSAISGVTFNSTLPANVVIADPDKLVVIPVKRTAFVKRINKVTIQDGIVLSNEINKPSSVEGFVSIPVNVAKAVVSIPAQLVQFRFDNTKKLEELEKAKLSYEKSLLESQKFSMTKENEIEKVKLELNKSGLSNQVELQKLKLELQTSLLEAEKKQLETQKALDEIKKQIEELKKP